LPKIRVFFAAAVVLRLEALAAYLLREFHLCRHAFADDRLTFYLIWRLLNESVPFRFKDASKIRRPCRRVFFIKRAFGSDGLMKFKGTTVLAVRRGDSVAIGADGQVSLGNTILKADAAKIRRLADGKVLTGFAGSTADAMALFERFETKLKEFPGNLPRAATELAKEWRTDRALRRLDAMLIAVDAQHTLLLSGTGDVLQPSDGILGIGSGGMFAVAAARALLRFTNLSARQIVEAALEITAEIDVYTNRSLIVEEISCRV